MGNIYLEKIAGQFTEEQAEAMSRPKNWFLTGVFGQKKLIEDAGGKASVFDLAGRNSRAMYSGEAMKEDLTRHAIVDSVGAGIGALIGTRYGAPGIGALGGAALGAYGTSMYNVLKKDWGERIPAQVKADILAGRYDAEKQASFNPYLEKLAGLPNVGEFLSKAKSTLGTAMGGKVNKIDSMIAKRQGIKAESKIRWQGANSVPNQPGAGINLGKNDVLRKETSTQLRADKHIGKLNTMRDKAELEMRRARSTVGKASLGAGAVGVGAHALLKNKTEYQQY